MTSLLVLAALLLIAWLWATWQRDGAAHWMRPWSYALLVTSVMCVVMAIGIALR